MPTTGDPKGRAALVLGLIAVMALAGLGIALLFSRTPPASGSPVPLPEDGSGGGKGGHAGHGGAPPAGEGEEAAGLLVDLGNARCPIMGGKPDGETWSEWNGLRVGHCCPMCTAKFQADPQKSLDKAGIDWKPAAAAVKKVNDAKGEEREKALKALRSKWKVVREPVPEPPAK